MNPFSLIDQRLVLTALLLSFMLPGMAPAQDKTAERNARRMQMLQQQMQQEKSQWESEKAALNKKLAEQEEELTRVKTDQQKSSDNVKRLDASRAEMGKAIADLQKKLSDQQTASEDQIVKKDIELKRLATLREQEHAQLQHKNDELSQTLSQSTEKNERLVQLGSELLARYRDKGVVDVLKQNEPLLKFGDVEMFNLVQEYRDKIDAQRFVANPANPVNQ